LRTGDLNAVRGHATAGALAASRSAVRPGYPQAGFALVAAQITEARDGAGSVADAFGPLCEEVVRHRWTLIADPAAAAWLVRTAHTLGARTAAEAVVTAAERLAEDNPGFPAARAAAAHARGLLDGSPASLEQAVTGHTGPWARASATEDLALLIASDETGDGRRRAVAAFDAALSAYEAMGAARDAARVRRRLRRLGVRRRHWSHTDRPVSGWASLTDTERAVAELVAQGLTNRQVADQLFMSAHTVAFHLRHVFRKLEIASRVELARLTLERSA
jgi:DNA-binding CsgD family transcriptional regulator